MSGAGMRLLVAGGAGLGIHLWWTRHTHVARARRGVPWRRWLAAADLDGVAPLELAAASAAASACGLLVGQLVFGAAVPALLLGVGAAGVPASVQRRRRGAAREHAREHWPTIIEEVRVLTGSAGRSIPQALFDAGARTPPELASAFEAAHREWLVTMDLEAAVGRLQDQLRDPFADAMLETLVIAHEVGGGRLDEQLRRLVDDRVLDLDNRRGARAEQAGVRFARRFVLVVPLGMAIAGLSIGEGRTAYQEPAAQGAAALGVALIVACWLWAGRFLRLPEPHRVLAR